MNHNNTKTGIPADTSGLRSDHASPAAANASATPREWRYQEIADLLLDDIKTGRLAPGQQLISIEELRGQLGCGYQNVMAAYDQLETESLIVRRHGVGVFVAGGERPQTASQRVRDILRERITNGRYKPGDQLPSNEDLRSEFKTGRKTLSRAVDELKAEGLVEVHVGHGTFVAGGQPPRSKVAAVADIVRREISCGILKPGDTLLTEVQLALKYGLSPNTIGLALSTLKAEGLLVGLKRAGTRVATASEIAQHEQRTR